MSKERHDFAPQRIDEQMIEAILTPLITSLPEKERLSLSITPKLAKLEKNWQAIVGSVLATHSRPTKIFKNTLFVACDHPIFASQIQMVQNTIFSWSHQELALELKKLRTFTQPNIWHNTLVTNQKISDITSKDNKVAIKKTSEALSEDLEKKKIKNIIEELEKEFQKKIN